MTSTLQRIENGVHRDGVCGSNVTGFSPVNSLHDGEDFHIVNNMLQCTSGVSTEKYPKVRMLASDTMAYILSKVLRDIDRYSSCTLLLRGGPHMSPCVKSIVSAYASSSAIMFVVYPRNGTYNVATYHRGTVSEVESLSVSKVSRLMSTLSSGVSSMYIAYPELTRDYTTILNSVKECSWCIPSSRYTLHTSELGTRYYSHFVFPWSDSSGCTGYTIGYGRIQVASDRQRNIYIGGVGVYESLISCTPYKSSCPDCYEMTRAGLWIRKVTEDKSPRPSKHRMRPVSVIALASLEEKVKLYSSHDSL